MSRLSRQVRHAAYALVAVPSLMQAQTGTVSGRVTDQATQQPLGEAQVLIAGTTRGTRTREDGTYSIAGVSAGTAQVRAIRLGYAAVTRPVAVTAGQTATLDFALVQTATQLDVVTVSATGESQRMREVGSNVGTITTENIPKGAVQSLSQVLNGRAAGVTVLQSGGTTGTGARIRIRGANSVSLSNEPLLIIDGVRLNNNPSSMSIGVGGQSVSRINDINPEDIENIEVFKGPAATSLYGTAAANGIVQITTKRGRAGATQWNVYAEGGTVREFNDYPPNYGAWGVFTGFESDGSLPGCDRITASFGDCTQDSVTFFNPLETNSPFRTGNRMRLGLNAAGGNDRAAFYLSGDREEERGIYVSSGLERTNLRSNIRSQLTNQIDAAVTVGYLSSRLRLPQNDNNFLGYISNGLAGVSDPQTDRSAQNEADGCKFRDGGYDPIGPCEINEIRTFQEIERFTGGVTGSYRPFSWLSITGNAGYDVINRLDNETIPPNRVDFSDLPEGSREANRFQTTNWTGNLAGTSTFTLTEGLVSTTSAGYQFQRELGTGVLASGSVLAAGSNSLEGLASRFDIGETFGDNRTVGVFLQQQFGLRDRLFLTAALRGDDNSAFGSDFGFVYYPTVSASWVLGEEPWFPKTRWLSELRLRSSFGRSGLRPTNRDPLTFFIPVPARANSLELSGITIGGLGLPNLKPEIVTEAELGFDAGLFKDRVNAEVTFFTKSSEDALIARRLPASVGAVTTRFENIGEVNNKGFEWLLRAAVLDRPNYQWGVSLQGSHIKNKLVTLGKDIAPIIFGLDATQQHREGFPLGGYWSRRVTGFADEDSDGQIGFGEVQYSDSIEYLGNTIPKHAGSVNTDLTLFGRVRVAALLDYRAGYKLYNSSESFRCGFFTCRGIQDPDAPIKEQVAAVAQVETNGEVLSEFIEDASFAKLREVSVTLIAPRAWASRLRTNELSLTLSGRNLGTWTSYSGLDPEVNSGGQANFSSFDFLSQPQVRYFVARLNLSF